MPKAHVIRSSTCFCSVHEVRPAFTRHLSLTVANVSQAGSSVVQEIKRINQRELDLGTNGSWHDDYKGAWLFINGLVASC